MSSLRTLLVKTGENARFNLSKFSIVSLSSLNSSAEASASRSNDPEVRRRRVRKRVTGVSLSDMGSEKKRKSRHRSKPAGKLANLKQRKWQFYAVLIVFLSGFLLTLTGTFSIGYHNSRSFRGKLLADLESGSGAAVSLSQLRVSPTLATARKVEYTWGEEERALAGVVLENVSSHYFIGGLLGKTWKGSDISAQSGKIYMKLGNSSEADEVDHFDYKSKYGVDRIKCNALNIYSADGGLLIKESFAHFKWGVKPMQLHLSGGSLVDTEFGEFSVDQAYVQIGSDSNKFFLQLSEKKGEGSIEVKGIIGGIDSTPLALKVENLPSSVIFGESLALLILGDWSGDNGKLFFKQTNVIGSRYDIHLTSPNLSLGRLDCFAVLAEVLRNNNYRRPQFRNSGELQIIKENDGVTIRDLSFSDRRWLALRGTLRVKDDVVEGMLKIGIPLHEKVNLEKHFSEDTFSSSSGGYLWETVHVTGKLGALKDDLRERLRVEGLQQAEKQGSPVKNMLNKAPETQEEIEAAFDQLISK